MIGLDKRYLKDIAGDDVKFVILQLADILGYMKGRTIPASALDDAIEDGIGFDGSSIPGFVSIEESDMVMKPDPSTLTVLPFYNEKVALVMCDIFRPGGRRFEGDVRYICQQALERAKSRGFTFNTGAELEFYTGKMMDGGEFEPIETNVKESQRYFDISPSRDASEDFRRDFTSALINTGKFTIEAYHHEVGHGQHEINVRFSDPVTTSDSILNYKFFAKEVAKRHGLIATFMPKPWYGRAGSGMHVHLSLFNKDGSNAFFDADKYAGLSEIGRLFIGGILAHSKALSALVAPTVNSYKRLVPGYEAPVYIMWSRKNRSALVRVPEYFPGKEKSVRAEFRVPDPLCNPYLAFAAILEAGLDGIERKLDPGDPIEKDVYHLSASERKDYGIDTLPESLSEALDELEGDEVVKAVLGRHILEKYLEIKRKEWDDYRLRVSRWETDRYLYT